MKYMLAIVCKDMRLALSGNSRLWSSFFFALLITILGGIALQGSTNPKDAVGMLWITIVFTSSFLIYGTLSDEKRRGLIDTYLVAGISAEHIWTAKTLFNWIQTFVIGLAILLFVTLLNNLNFGLWLAWCALLILMVTYGLAAIGTLFSAMVGENSAQQALFPIIYYPLILPLVIPAIYATQRLLEGLPMEALHFVLVFDLVATALGIFFSQFLVED